MTRPVERGRRGLGMHRGVAPAYGSGQETPPVDTGGRSTAHAEDRPPGRPDGGPADDGLAGELAAATRRRWWNRQTVYLGAAVLLVGGFVAGAEVQKAYGTSAQPGPVAGQGQQRGQGGFPGAQGGGGFPGGGGQPGGGDQPAGGAAAATGTVKMVDGTTLYVQTADGSVLTVRTGGDTAVKIAKDGSLKELKAGDTVTVEGANSAGTVTATSVTGQAR